MATKNMKKKQGMAARQLRTPANVPPPRTKIQRMNRAGSAISSRYLMSTITTAATGAVSGGFNVAPAVHGNNDPAAAVVKNYQEYQVNSTRLHWVPQVGSTTSGIVFLAYIDNPEIIYNINIAGYTPSVLLQIAQSVKHQVSGPIWMPLELAGMPTTRRKVLSVDSSNPASPEVVDRTISGMYIVCITGGPISTLVGTVSHEYSATSFELQNFLFTGV